jgi:phenylpropionate dioxygenase-like ring-hydroxylating dioxygenase large terminal subunit
MQESLAPEAAAPAKFAKGWYLVCWSADLEPSQVKPLRYFGKNYVLFRGEDGKATLLDAHCPHLGAHLGYGGRVEGNDIICPFHAWRFVAPRVVAPRYHTHLAYLLAPRSMRIGFRNTAG